MPTVVLHTETKPSILPLIHNSQCPPPLLAPGNFHGLQYRMGSNFVTLEKGDKVLMSKLKLTKRRQHGILFVQKYLASFSWEK